MIPSFTSDRAPVTPPNGARPERAWLHEQVRLLAPVLDPESDTFRAAVLLLAGRCIGQNVDRLARITGLRREFVARCARRLVDNGVWQNGDTVCEWSDPQGGALSFWGDVGVAEGKLCRRRGEDGSMQWAPPGEWWKAFDFVQKAVDETPGVAYQPRAVYVPSWEDEIRAPEPEAVDEPPPARPTRPAPEPVAPSGSQWIGGPGETIGQPHVPFLGAPDQFGGAVWFGLARR